MPTYDRPYFIKMCCLTLLLLIQPSPAFPEVIDGFRELKFGMTKEEVQSLERCSSPTECLYELAGKNRYIHLSYYPEQNSQARPTLARISIDMGHFSNEWYANLQNILQKQYQLTHDLRESDIDAFEKERVSELTSGYENGQVLLQVVRRTFGNLILKVIYQSPALAAATLQQLENSSHS
ncbi:MAG: hypothetical protein MRJ96_16765 [Nitrospirales bacterium]|nr:hypothetical protein [Nitrospira sp.]MDR4503097.1 hypothetical protein [Nitrospirales bacterium]